MKVVRSSERSITSSALWLMTLTITTTIRIRMLAPTYVIKSHYANRANSAKNKATDRALVTKVNETL